MKEKDSIFLILAGLLLLSAGKKAKFRAPVKGRVSSPFGKRGSTFHNGIDIAVPVGTAVKAPAGGTVARIYTTSNGGKQMIVNHDNGFTSGYAHLDKFYFGAGAKVKKGTVIAKSGSTGNLTGAHLHFSWRKDGKYKNPSYYFSF